MDITFIVQQDFLLGFFQGTIESLKKKKIIHPPLVVHTIKVNKLRTFQTQYDIKDRKMF